MSFASNFVTNFTGLFGGKSGGGGGDVGGGFSVAGGVPPPPPPPPPPAPKFAKDLYSKPGGPGPQNAGMSSTILTSPQGFTSPAITGQKSLLGQ